LWRPWPWPSVVFRRLPVALGSAGGGRIPTGCSEAPGGGGSLDSIRRGRTEVAVPSLLLLRRGRAALNPRPSPLFVAVLDPRRPLARGPLEALAVLCVLPLCWLRERGSGSRFGFSVELLELPPFWLRETGSCAKAESGEGGLPSPSPFRYPFSSTILRDIYSPVDK